jgi:hypothetical protein
MQIMMLCFIYKIIISFFVLCQITITGISQDLTDPAAERLVEG